jgi:YD repeat-containing protein
VTQLQEDVSKYEYGYNADNEETSQSDLGTTGVSTVTYDADGDRTSMDDSLGGLVSYSYDNRDELINGTLSVSRARPADGLRGDGAGSSHGVERGGPSGRESGDGEVDESGSIGSQCGGS